MAPFRYECSLGLHTRCLQRLEECLSLAAGHHVILLTMEDNHRRVVGIDIVVGTQTDIFVGLLGEL